MHKPETSKSITNKCLLILLAPFRPAGQPPARFRNGGNDNVNDLQSFIGRGISNLRSIGKSKKASDNGGRRTSDDLSPRAAAAADKLPA